MFSRGELTALASGKAAVLQRIEANRAQCAEEAGRIGHSIQWFDQTLVRWRRLSPIIKFAAMPIGSFLLKRWLGSRARRQDRR
jgi:hypothetical protein